MLKKELLDILVCPKCKSELKYETDPKDDKQGKLICEKCQLYYRVEDDIPVMLIEEAVPLSENTNSSK